MANTGIGWVNSMVDFIHECLLIEVNQSITCEDVESVFTKMASERNQYPQLLQEHNGPKFVSLALDRWAYESDGASDFSGSGKFTDNPFIESFNGSFRDKCLNTNWFMSLRR